MKTITIQNPCPTVARCDRTPRIGLDGMLRLRARGLRRGLTLLLPVALALVLTTWALNSGAHDVLAASLWAGGFVLLALSVEHEGRLAATLSVIGLLSMLLAWLGYSLAPELSVVAGALLGASAAALLWRARYAAVRD